MLDLEVIDDPAAAVVARAPLLVPPSDGVG
jgi:hypothetical protein